MDIKLVSQAQDELIFKNKPISFSSQIPVSMSTGFHIASLRRLVKSTKGRRVSAPLSRGYIEDVDGIVNNQNPRYSVDNAEVFKHFQKLPELDTLAYDTARKDRTILRTAFPPTPFDKASILRDLQSTLDGLRQLDALVPNLEEFSNNSRFNRTEETNTLEYNISILNTHIDSFRANDYRILSHDYRSTDKFGYLPKVKVFSTSNGSLKVDKQVCTRRTQINGESHFIVKYGENGALPDSGNVEFLYTKLTNRLSLYLNSERTLLENLSVAYNLDPRNLRSLYLRDVDIIFHDLGPISVELLVDTKRLARYFDRMGFTGQYTHVYLDELIKEDALLGIWVAKSGHCPMNIDVVNNRRYDLIKADAENAKMMWHIAHVDNSKRHYCKIGSKVSYTAYSGLALVEAINTLGKMKYGTMIKAIHENEVSGRLKAWLESPLLGELIETHDDSLFKQMTKDLGKLHTINVTIDGLKVHALAASFDFLDLEKENEIALLFSTYFAMIEHLKKAQTTKQLPKVVTVLDSTKAIMENKESAEDDRTQAMVKMFAYTEMPVSLLQFGQEATLYDELKSGTSYSSSEKSFSQYIDDFLLFQGELKSKIEITSIGTDAVHILLKGVSFNNNYNEEFVLTWKDKLTIHRIPMQYLAPISSTRNLNDPTKLVLDNDYKSSKTKTITSIDQFYDYFGKEIRTGKRFFY